MKKIVSIILFSAINTVQAYSTIICNNTSEQVNIELDYVFAHDFFASIPAKTCINQENLNTEHKNVVELYAPQDQFPKVVRLIKKLQKNSRASLNTEEMTLYDKYQEQINKAVQAKSNIFVPTTGSWGAAAFRGFTIEVEEKVNNKKLKLDHKFSKLISADLLINICYSINYKNQINGLVATIRAQNPSIPFTEFTVTDEKKSYTYGDGIPLAGTENLMTDLNAYDKIACLSIDKQTLQKVKKEGYAPIKTYSVGILSALLDSPATTIEDWHMIDANNVEIPTTENNF